MGKLDTSQNVVPDVGRIDGILEDDRQDRIVAPFVGDGVFPEGVPHDHRESRELRSEPLDMGKADRPLIIVDLDGEASE